MTELNMSNSKDLTIRDDDQILEFRDKKIDPPQKINSLAVYTDNKNFKLPHKNSQNNKITLYQKFIQRKEFKRPETKEIVLDEDEYLNCLEEIIQKEYYPDLAKNVTENRQNILDERMDKINREYLQEKLLEEKNGEKKDNSSSNTINKEKIKSLNVDSFCLKYSSDELESLKDILHKDQKRKLNKHFWMYEQEFKANEKIQQIKDYSEQFLALPAGNDKHYQIPITITAEADAKNTVFFHPSLSLNYKTELEREKEKIISQQEINNSSNFSQNLQSSSNDKQILKENTRLPPQFLESLMSKHSHHVKRQIFEAYENSDVVKLLKELNEIQTDDEKNKIASDTPMVNGYKLIKDPNLDVVPIFTWGEVASTPNLLSENKPSAKFTIPQTPTRENIAHTLVNKNMQKKKIQKEKEDNT